MPNIDAKTCFKCSRFIRSNTQIKCDLCKQLFHVRCCSLKSLEHFRKLKNSGIDWYCLACNDEIFPFSRLSDPEFNLLFSPLPVTKLPNKKTKCGYCGKKRFQNKNGFWRFAHCSSCSSFSHLGCEKLTYNDFPLPCDWKCTKCLSLSLPFSSISNDNLLATLKGVNATDTDFLKNVPTFSIKTLLDQFPGDKFAHDDFISDTVESKYYSPAEFLYEPLPKGQFSIIHLNIASLQLHIDELRNLLKLLHFSFDVICITETRLHEQVPLVDVSIEGYDFIHKETPSQCGGAAIYIKSHFEYDQINNLSVSIKDVCESIFIEIKGKNRKKTLIGCIYRHHTTIEEFSNEYFNNAIASIAKSKKTCILTGDFNIDLIKYGHNPDVSLFYDCVSVHGFRPLILQPSRLTNSSATLIDNIFTNDLTCYSKGGNITSSISDHLLQFSILDIASDFDISTENKAKFSRRNWRIFNKREFDEELKSINWSDIIKQDMDTDTSCASFLGKINFLLDEMAPYKKVTKKEFSLQRKPWITHGLLKSMSIRDKLYKDFASETDENRKKDLHSSYKDYRNKIVFLLRKSKKQHFTNFFKEHNTNIKKTWEGIKSLIDISKKKSTRIQKIIENDKVITDSKGIANSLNSFYSNIGPSIDNKIPKVNKSFNEFLGNPINNTITFEPCNDTEIANIIKNFSPSKSSGPNSIPTNLLKEFSYLLCTPIKMIINKSLTEGTFPSLLKIANICPIFKKNDKTKCANYRPISLLSNLSKIFERIVYNRLESFLNENDIIYQHQYGFRKNYSTNHAVLSILEEIRLNLDKKIFSCGVFVDLEKAFDTVNHKILIEKLNHYGIKGIPNKWFTSYLSNRTQSVSLNGTLSENQPVHCGVPQGSILGPLLFLIYINDMNKALKKCKVYHFADDTNLLFSDPDPIQIRKIMNKELKLLFEWLCANRLSLNVAKTEFIIFRPPRMNPKDRIVLELNRTKIFESPKIKYLGLILDSRLTWKFHIAELTKKLSRSVGMLFKIRDYTPRPVLVSLYHSLFNSHLT